MVARDLATDFARAVSLHQKGRLGEAAALYGEILCHRSDLIDAHLNLALALRGLGRRDDALKSYERAIACDPDCAEAHFGYGALLQAAGGNYRAIAAYDTAIRLNPHYAEAWSNRGNALQAVERNEDAVDSYDRAVALNPKYVEAHFNRAHALNELGRCEDAVAAYDRALHLNPTSAEAWSNRGSVLAQLGRREEALASYRRGIASDPNHQGSRRNIFWHNLAEGRDPNLVQRLGADAAALITRQMVANLKAKAAVPDFRVLHDLEQSEYLLAHSGPVDGLDLANRVLSRIRDRAGAMGLTALSAEEVAVLGHYRAGSFLPSPDATPGPCLNPDNDWNAIEETYLAGRPEIVCIDNFLSPLALERLRTFCLTSTAWKYEYGNGYLGALADNGFISPLQMQIMTEIKARMPRVFENYPVTQLWGFKYMSRGAGTGVHADFARVNLNFWITPDDANRDPASGGMIVYDVPAPRSWNFREYNGHSQRVYDFLRSQGAGQRKIPYKCNRAVLFNSNLFHETDRFDFKDGYENHRVNITYLFGQGLKTGNA